MGYHDDGRPEALAKFQDKLVETSGSGSWQILIIHKPNKKDSTIQLLASYFSKDIFIDTVKYLIGDLPPAERLRIEQRLIM